jgi:hypothetical protein
MTNRQMADRVGAAGRAAWVTLLIGAIWMTVAYLLWLAVMHAQPAWLIALWGGGELTWSDVQEITLWFFGGVKLMLFAVLFGGIWLSLWGRRLRRLGE